MWIAYLLILHLFAVLGVYSIAALLHDWWLDLREAKAHRRAHPERYR